MASKVPPGPGESAEAMSSSSRMSWLQPVAGFACNACMPQSSMIRRPNGCSARLRKNPSGFCFH